MQQEDQARKDAVQAVKDRYTHELTGLAQESGLLALAGQMAFERGGSLAQEVSYYVDYGHSPSCVPPNLVSGVPGNLCASHLVLRITWEPQDALLEAEVYIHKNGQVTFHNNPVPVFAFIWRRAPGLLPNMLKSAVEHPRSPSE